MKRILILVGILCLSCNTRIFINKSKVIHEVEGYLLYYRSDKCLFIPNKEASIDFFLKDTSIKKGYLLNSICGIDGLKFIADKFNVDMIYLDNRQEVFLPDSIYITTTKFRYLLNKIKTENFADTVEFIYKKRRYKIGASDDFYGEVLKIEGNMR